MNKKIIILILLCLILCGCKSKKCVKFHIENTECIKCQPIASNDVCLMRIYNCQKEICDEYEDEYE